MLKQSTGMLNASAKECIYHNFLVLEPIYISLILPAPEFACPFSHQDNGGTGLQVLFHQVHSMYTHWH